MPDINKIQINGTTYNIADEVGRDELGSLESAIAITDSTVFDSILADWVNTSTTYLYGWRNGFYSGDIGQTVAKTSSNNFIRVLQPVGTEYYPWMDEATAIFIVPPTGYAVKVIIADLSDTIINIVGPSGISEYPDYADKPINLEYNKNYRYYLMVGNLENTGSEKASDEAFCKSVKLYARFSRVDDLSKRGITTKIAAYASGFYPTSFKNTLFFDYGTVGAGATQGMCSDKTNFIWFTYRETNADSQVTTIVKADIRTGQIIKSVSEREYGHANGMCYIRESNEIWITSWVTDDTVYYDDGGTADRISVIDADTLLFKRAFGLKSVLGETFGIDSLKPFLSTIAYHSGTKIFVGSLSPTAGSRGLVLFTLEGGYISHKLIYHNVSGGVDCDNSYIYALFGRKLYYYDWGLTEIGVTTDAILEDVTASMGTTQEDESICILENYAIVNANSYNDTENRRCRIYRSNVATTAILPSYADLANQLSITKNAFAVETGNTFMENWGVGVIPIPAKGEIIESLSPVESDSRSTVYQIIQFSAGANNVFTINVIGGSTGRAFAFVDNNNVVIDRASSNENVENRTITAPQNATKLIVQNNLNSKPSGYYVIEGAPLQHRLLNVYVNNRMLVVDL